jgi:predicted HTH transcriptional regulator
VELIGIAGADFCDPVIEPRIDIVPVMGKDVILAFVEESSTKPHFFLGESGRDDHANIDDIESTRVYIRVNDTTVAASKEVVKILQNENPNAPPLTMSIGDNERRLFEYLEEHKRITTPGFGKLVNVSDRRASRMLVRLVRAGVIRIHTHEKQDFFTLAQDIEGLPVAPPRAVRGVAK